MNVEIACVIDRSGSMESICNDAIGGFNSFLREQKAAPGTATLTLVLFDHQYLVLHNGVDLQAVPELTRETFVPRGSTALYDAIGRTIDSIGARLDKAAEKPDKVIVVILTDGGENTSHAYTRDQVASMIRHQEEKYAWEFVFLAANQDAFQTGAALNIKACNTANFAATGEGITRAYAGASGMTLNYRGAGQDETPC